VYLLDTDILIYALKGHSRVRKNLEAHVEEPMALSVISLLELNYGAHKSRHRDANLVKVRALEEAFEVVPVALEISQAFGGLKASLEEKGTPLDDFDIIIAATALSRNLTLVSNNVKHFRRIDGLALENWA